MLAGSGTLHSTRRDQRMEQGNGGGKVSSYLIVYRVEFSGDRHEVRNIVTAMHPCEWLAMKIREYNDVAEKGYEERSQLGVFDVNLLWWAEISDAHAYVLDDVL